MLYTKNVKVITEVGHYPLSEVDGKKALLNSGERDLLTLTPAGETTLYKLTLAVEEEVTEVEVAGDVTLLDGSLVAITSLFSRQEVDTPSLDKQGNPVLNEEGQPVLVKTVINGSLLKAHNYFGKESLEVLKVEPVQTEAVYSIDLPVLLSCGLFN